MNRRMHNVMRLPASPICSRRTAVATRPSAFQPLFLVLLTCMFSLTVPSHAQQKPAKRGEVRVYVGAEDSFTKVGLPAFITLLSSDSTVIDTVTCQVHTGSSFATLYIPKVSGEYMVRAEYPGYKPAVVRQRLDFTKAAPAYGFPMVQMKRLPNAADSLRSVGLDEVVVSGTRLQVAYRGDTLVYDAQAFNIPEGAMLDALVRQLPGAELKANGDVYVNGRRLDYITLNGNDFFKGNNKVILENLPYFVVKELQVYYKDPPFAQSKDLTDDEKHYVMDVVMKREYAIGSIVNAEAGTGTDDRWKAKAFGLRYDDYTRLTVFGNLNNVNEDRTPGTDGDWSPKKQSRGTLTTKQAGMNLNVNNSKKDLTLDQSALLEWSDQNTTSQRRSETFSPEGSIFGGQTSYSRMKDFTLTEKLNFYVWLGKLSLSTNHYITYTDGEGTSASADSTYHTGLTNTDRRMSLTDSRNIYGNGYLGLFLPLRGPYKIGLNTNYSFGYLSRDRSQTLRDIQYMNTGAADGSNDYRDNSSRNYRYSVSVQQGYTLSQRVSLNLDIAYEQHAKGQDHGYYHLYPYGGRYESDMALPSTADSLQAAIDRSNSHSHFTLGRGASSMLRVSYRWKNTTVHVSAKYDYTHERIHYRNDETDTVARRSYGSWNPNLQVYHKWKNNKFTMRYYTVHSRPDFAMLMPLSNTSNPLYIRLSNPNLRSQQRNTVNMELDMRPGGMKPTWWMKYEIVTQNRAWGNRVSYDTATGAYTSMANNVDGNWNTTLSFGMNGPIDKQKRWRYDVSAKAGYVHSVDFNTAYDGGDNELSRVNTIRPETTWKLNYRNGNFSAGAVAKFSGNFSHEEEYGLRDMSVRTYQLGLNTQYTIPVVKLTIGTDINLYSQGGYESEAMNTDDWVWNAAISRPLFKGKVVAKVEMYDILHQLSARSYRVNAQSRVETFYNSIPHYMMLSLAYKFAKSPKKQ